MEPTARFGRRTSPQASWAPTPAPAPAPAPAPGPRVRSWLAPPSTPTPMSERVAPDVAKGFPWLTGGLLVALAVILWLQNQYAFGVRPGLAPGYASIVAEGASSRTMVFAEHQWWRVFTAPLLHGSLAHLVGNGITLLFIGWYLERLLGQAWFAFAFLVGGLGGEAGSLLLNPADTAGVGASGAIMGLLATAFICSFHVEAHQGRGRAQWWIARATLPALIPHSSEGGMVVDYSAHAGGAVAGVLLGFVIMGLWPETQSRPSLRPVALSLALAGLAATLLSAAMTVGGYPGYKARVAQLIPDGEITSNTQDMAAKAAEFVANYPSDPRSHLYRAIYWAGLNDAPEMIGELRTGLADPAAFSDLMPGAVQPTMRLMLATVLMAEHRQAEAHEAVGAACNYPFPGPSLAKLVRELRDNGVCSWTPAAPG